MREEDSCGMNRDSDDEEDGSKEDRILLGEGKELRKVSVLCWIGWSSPSPTPVSCSDPNAMLTVLRDVLILFDSCLYVCLCCAGPQSQVAAVVVLV